MMQNENKKPNRLIHSSSPYLLQHAYNPVDWYEWCDEAFEKAKREEKLVLVSIGYSSCHWCHVMEKECFEKMDTAEIMNNHFVCIKVDREERPDVDQIYMDAIQLLTGQGGWPLNCFVLPDGRPIHAGTYFPKQEWEKTLISLAEFYKERKEEALQYASELTKGIKKLNTFTSNTSTEVPDKDAVNQLLSDLQNSFDVEHGGFTWTPKFPMPSIWELYLQHQYFTKNTNTLQAVENTLNKMAQGGINDQIGGGFSRYSVDRFWKVPHFEKMLYDNAQLVSLYANAYRITANPVYAGVVNETISFLNRELKDAQGYYYSALDADSEGIEGKYYLWKHQEIIELLGNDEALFSLFYTVDKYGNWEHEANILYQTRSLKDIAKLMKISELELSDKLNHAKQILLKERQKRIAPGLDDKMITAWNALMIKALVDAYKALQERSYLDDAVRLFEFLQTKVLDEIGLKRIFKNDKASINAFADDYAFFIESAIKLYEASGNEQYLIIAKQQMDTSIQKFFSTSVEFFVYRALQDSQLISTKIDLNDDVIPSSNSVFAKSLWILGFVFDNAEYHKIVKRMVGKLQSKIAKHPSAYSNWIQLINWINYGFNQVVISGKNTNECYSNISSIYTPNAMVFQAQPDTMLPLLKEKTSTNELKIYVCKDYTCGLPLYSVEETINTIKP